MVLMSERERLVVAQDVHLFVMGDLGWQAFWQFLGTHKVLNAHWPQIGMRSTPNIS